MFIFRNGTLFDPIKRLRGALGFRDKNTPDLLWTQDVREEAARRHKLKVKKAIAAMGNKYICHPDNYVKRKQTE
jgi:hypothetical protein